MATAITIISLAAFAAFIPLAQVQRTSWFVRLFKRREPRQVVAPAPPAIDNDAGWQLIHSEDVESFRDWLSRESQGLPYRSDELPSLGSHLLVELFDCDPSTLKQESCVGEVMKEAARESQATVVAESFHEFKPYGVSGAVIIQESHYTIHTWPEHGYAAVDLFYCGGTVHVEKAVDVLRERFRPGRIKFLIVRRGIQSEVSG